MKNINLNINFVTIDEQEINFECNDQKFNEELKNLVKEFNETDCKSQERIDLCDQVYQFIY